MTICIVFLLCAFIISTFIFGIIWLRQKFWLISFNDTNGVSRYGIGKGIVKAGTDAYEHPDFDLLNSKMETVLWKHELYKIMKTVVCRNFKGKAVKLSLEVQEVNKSDI